MGTYVGNTLVAGATFNPTLLDFKWTDHILNDVSWLRADTFSWQPGNVYIAVQDFLEENYTPQMLYCWGSANTEFVYSKKRVPEVGDILYDSTGVAMTPTRTVLAMYGEDYIDYAYYESGGTHEFMTQRYTEGNVEQLETETIAGTTISYCRGANGLKIVPATQESNVQAIYNATGVAWYYVLDATNKRFKLPRSKHNRYATTLGVVGNGSSIYVRSSGGTVSDTRIQGWKQPSGAGYKYLTTETSSQTAGTNNETVLLSTDPTKSGMIAPQDQDTDEYKYLYFYMGQFTQTAIENTAGINAEDFNGKADTDFGNTSMIDYVTSFQRPTAENNYTWYRKYKSGWIEQGGRNNGLSAVATITMPNAMADIAYSVLITRLVPTTADDPVAISHQVRNLTTTTFQVRQTFAAAGTGSGPSYAYVWEVKGMAA